MAGYLFRRLHTSWSKMSLWKCLTVKYKLNKMAAAGIGARKMSSFNFDFDEESNCTLSTVSMFSNREGRVARLYSLEEPTKLKVEWNSCPLTNQELKDYFEYYGLVTDILRFYPRYLAYVKFRHPDSVRDALKHEHVLKGATLRLCNAHRRYSSGCSVLYVCDPPKSISNEAVLEHYSKYGNVVRVVFLPDLISPYAGVKGILVFFESEEDCETALREDSFFLDGKKLVVRRHDVIYFARKLIVKNISQSTTVQDLYNYFKLFGKLHSIIMLLDRKAHPEGDQTLAHVLYHHCNCIVDLVSKGFHRINGDLVTVKWTHSNRLPPIHRNSFLVQNLPYDTTIDEVREIFESHVNGTSVVLHMWYEHSKAAVFNLQDADCLEKVLALNDKLYVNSNLLKIRQMTLTCFLDWTVFNDVYEQG